MFSFRRAIFWKWPKRFRIRVTVSFGAPMLPIRSRSSAARPSRSWPARRWISQDALGYASAALRSQRARKNWSRSPWPIPRGRELTYGRSPDRRLLVCGWLRQYRPAEAMIGVMLPADRGGSASECRASRMAGGCAGESEFHRGQGSHGVGDRAMPDPRPSSLRRRFWKKPSSNRWTAWSSWKICCGRASGWRNLRAAARAICARAVAARTRSGTPDSLATIIFSSGSTGEPKGVMLSHYNVHRRISKRWCRCSG